jgi:hypothetical protein
LELLCIVLDIYIYITVDGIVELRIKQFSITAPPPDIQTRMNIDPAAVFPIGGSVMGTMLTKLGGLFAGSASARNGINCYSSDVIHALWDAGDPISWMENIALSVTNHIRQRQKQYITISIH